MRNIKSGLLKKSAAYFNNMNMRKKLVFLYIFTVLLPFLATGLIYTNYTKNMVEKQTLSKLKSDIQHYSDNLNTLMLTYTMSTNLIANNSELVSDLERKYTNVVDSLSLYQTLWQLHKNNVQTLPHVENITIYSANQTLYNSFPYLIRMDTYMKELPVHDAIMSRGFKGLWSNSRLIRKGEFWNPSNAKNAAGLKVNPDAHRTFTYNRVIYSAKIFTVPIGIITLEINIDSIHELIHSQEVDIFILDETGEEVTSSGKPWKEEYEALLPTFSDDVVSHKHKFDKNYYYTDSTLLKNGWTVVLMMSSKQAFREATSLRLYGTVLFLVISLLIIPLIILFSRLLSGRLYKLLLKMENFMNGKLLLGKDIGGHDEIGLLDEKFTSLATELKKTIEETYILQLQKTEYHLQMLQAQINPHFLYNTLSTIAWLSDNNPREEVRSAIENLATFYRVTLSKGKHMIPLSEEIQGLRAYTELQKIKYLTRLNIYYQIDELLLDTRLPALTLQPIVENGIQHGMSAETESISIAITATLIEDMVEIKIQDDGTGIPASILEDLRRGEVISKEGNGLGFHNIDERIKLYFGPTYGLQIDSRAGYGTVVKIFLPFT